MIFLYINFFYLFSSTGKCFNFRWKGISYSSLYFGTIQRRGFCRFNLHVNWRWAFSIYSQNLWFKNSINIILLSVNFNIIFFFLAFITKHVNHISSKNLARYTVELISTLLRYYTLYFKKQKKIYIYSIKSSSKYENDIILMSQTHKHNAIYGKFIFNITSKKKIEK